MLFPSLLFLASFSPAAHAAAPTSFTYQGNLWENGLPVNATKTLRFKIYDQLTGSNPALWDSGDINNVSVTKGHFKVELTPTVSWATNTFYIEVLVEGQPISPRDTFNTVPYALTSGAVNDPLVIGTLQGKNMNTGITVSSNLYVTAGSLVGIGTTNPGAALEVAGQIKITGGSPAAGKVLFSDATGLADWRVAQGLAGAAVMQNGSVISAAVSTFGYNGAFSIDASTPGQAHFSMNTASVTLQGNTFNQANRLVKMNASGFLPVDGNGLSLLAPNSVGSGHIIDSTITVSDLKISEFDARWVKIGVSTDPVQTIGSEKTFGAEVQFSKKVTFPDNGSWRTDGKVTIGTSTFDGKFTVSASTHQIVILDKDGATNSRKWDINADGNVFNIQAANDNFDTFRIALQATRSGAQVSSVVFPNGAIGFGGGDSPVFTPRSTLHVPQGEYAQFENNGTTDPRVTAIADCNEDAERGRLYIDTTDNRLYICNGASRGWDYIALNP